MNDERRDAATEGGNENPRVSLLMPYCGVCAKAKLFYWIQRKMFFINKKKYGPLYRTSIYKNEKMDLGHVRPKIANKRI